MSKSPDLSTVFPPGMAEFMRKMSASLQGGHAAPLPGAATSWPRSRPSRELGDEVIGQLFATSLLLPRVLSLLANQVENPERWLEGECNIALAQIDTGCFSIQPESERERLTEATKQAVKMIFRNAGEFFLPKNNPPPTT